MSPLTPLEKFSSHLYLKREDLSETGSHKFRYLKQKLVDLKKKGIDQVVLSTTGNAGITASFYGKLLGIKVFALMAEKGEKSKAQEIVRHGGFIVLTTSPIRFSKYLTKKYNVPLLRASYDEMALQGYESLGEEIIEQLPSVDAIVNFCTSGTSSIGMMRAFEKKGLKLPVLHIVQSGKSCGIVRQLHPELIPEIRCEDVGLQDTPRRKQLLKMIMQSQGDAWYVKPDEIAEPFETSFEGLCSLHIGKKLEAEYQSIVVILSGKKWPDQDHHPLPMANSISELDRLWQQFSTSER